MERQGGLQEYRWTRRPIALHQRSVGANRVTRPIEAAPHHSAPHSISAMDHSIDGQQIATTSVGGTFALRALERIRALQHETATAISECWKTAARDADAMRQVSDDGSTQ